jgi:deazaflavin-dependent oxidoreductase (nitroreductase family)
VASNFGSRTAPQWYLNLQKRPEAEVQLKSRRWEVHARLATPDEWMRLWSAALAIWPAWAGYAERARRDIPIVVLESTR